MRSDAVVIVTCDGCGNEVEEELCPLALEGAWDDRYVNERLSSAGWTFSAEDGDLCEECSMDKKEEALGDGD